METDFVIPVEVKLACSLTTFTATVTVIVSGGVWGTNSTWDCKCQPAPGDIIFISVGITVDINFTIIDLRGPEATTINVFGGIDFYAGGAKIDLRDVDVLKSRKWYSIDCCRSYIKKYVYYFLLLNISL